MMRKLLFTIAVLSMASCSWAACTNTTNYSLCKPASGDVGWATNVNNNFDTIDTQMKANADDIDTNDTATALNTAKTTNATHTGDVTGSGALTIADDKVLESHLKAVDAAGDEECLTYETTTGDFEWQACSATSGDLLADGTVPMTADFNLDGNNVDNGGVVFLKEQAEADADVAGSGQIWVNTATPNELWFTDDAGTDTQLGVGGSSITGTDTQVLFFDGDNSPAGDAGMTYNKTTDTLTVGSVATTAAGQSVVDEGLVVNNDGGATETHDFVVNTDTVSSAFECDAGDDLCTFNVPIRIAERADADVDLAGYGQLWVNTATPNELWFTDDAGTDVQLGVGEANHGNGANCSAGSYPLGVDADGAVESCTDATTEIDSAISAVDLQTVFDVGQTITVANTDNQTLTVTQNDTTNNPVAVEIVNTGSGDALKIDSDGAGAAFTINQSGNNRTIAVTNSGTNHGMHINQSGVNAGGDHGLYVSSAVAQVNADSALAKILQDHASSTEPSLEIVNDGTGNALLIDQNGNGYGIRIDNAGIVSAQNIVQTGVLAADQPALNVDSTTNQTNATSSLLRVNQDNASSVGSTALIRNDGTGVGLKIDQNGNGQSLNIDSEATTADLMNIDSLTTANVIDIYNGGAAGTGIRVNSVSNGTHLNFIGDPTVASPVDGDLWYDGTELKLYDGTSTHNLAPLYDTKCLYIEDPTAADDLASIWANKTPNNFQLTELWCESDQTVDFDLQVDDGTPADVNGTDVQCAAGEGEDTSLSGDTTLAAGEELDLVVTSVANTPTWVSICFTGYWTD